MLRFFPALWILLSFIWACNTPAPQDTTLARQAVLKADTDFSGLSRAKGFRLAFLAYADSTAVLLREQHPPIEGNAAFKYLESMNDSGVTLTWEPSFASVAASGDLAYTYGIYTFAAKDTSTRGTYVTIWKRTPPATGNSCSTPATKGWGNKGFFFYLYPLIGKGLIKNSANNR